ncbi:putative sensor with CHASE2 domain protein [Nostoc sp. NIES-4103]|nr:putative sensor with CHASE2 domain protein [Nostoc sp. NIES-4103]
MRILLSVNFRTIITKTFDPIDEQYLSLENKQELCQFLEEALCNVGKHALGVRCIQAIGKEQQGCIF